MGSLPQPVPAVSYEYPPSIRPPAYSNVKEDKKPVSPIQTASSFGKQRPPEYGAPITNPGKQSQSDHFPFVNFPSETRNGKSKVDMALVTHFNRRLQAKGRTDVYGADFMFFWRLAGHNEDTLRALCRHKNPADENQLQMILIKEVAKICNREAIPKRVNAMEVVGETVCYFFPQDDEVREQNAAAIEFVDLTEEERPEDTSLPPGFENRFQRLKPFADYLEQEMLNDPAAIGIPDYQVHVMAKDIQKLLAQEEICVEHMKAMRTIYGEHAIPENLAKKLGGYGDLFQKVRGITISWIANKMIQFFKRSP